MGRGRPRRFGRFGRRLRGLEEWPRDGRRTRPGLGGRRASRRPVGSPGRSLWPRRGRDPGFCPGGTLRPFDGRIF